MTSQDYWDQMELEVKLSARDWEIAARETEWQAWNACLGGTQSSIREPRPVYQPMPLQGCNRGSRS